MDLAVQAQLINPPPALTEAHFDIVLALTIFADGEEMIADGLKNDNDWKVEFGTETMIHGSELIAAATAVMQDM